MVIMVSSLELTQALFIYDIFYDYYDILFIYDKFVRKPLKVPDTKDEQNLVCGYNLLFNTTQGIVDSK